MCFDQQRFLLVGELIPSRNRSANGNAVVEALQGRLAETEARLERARAREAELTRRLEDMKRFISVMEILETYLERRFRERQAQIDPRLSAANYEELFWYIVFSFSRCVVRKVEGKPSSSTTGLEQWVCKLSGSGSFISSSIIQIGSCLLFSSAFYAVV